MFSMKDKFFAQDDEIYCYLWTYLYEIHVMDEVGDKCSKNLENSKWRIQFNGVPIIASDIIDSVIHGRSLQCSSKNWIILRTNIVTHEIYISELGIGNLKVVIGQFCRCLRFF